MVVLAADIKYYLSGGAGNSTPVASLGGAISTTELVDNSAANLFANADGTETLAGSTKYLCLYVKNTSAQTFYSAQLYVTQVTTSTEDEITMALGSTALGTGTEQTIANITTAPTGLAAFSAPTTYATGLVIGDMTAGQWKAIWFKRVINASLATPVDANTFKFETDGDTAA
jgi:hypothetical protein